MFLPEKIESSETKFKKILEEFFKGIYNPLFLQSHGIDHHRRVWHYAKEILYQLEGHGFEISQSLTDKLIIACFLHDSGMSVDSGFRHGTESRKIGERFFCMNDLSADEYEDVLRAIENHDNKEYTVLYQPGDLMTILSVADDLDAFGFIGIYRYLEIYIARKKPIQELGYMIIENSENRFHHFLRIYGSYNEFFIRHSKRYNIVSSFFDSYNQQVAWYKFDNHSESGHCGIAEIIMQMLNGSLPATPINFPVTNYCDPIINWFFGEMNIELTDFR
jgi:hypothetical protein